MIKGKVFKNKDFNGVEIIVDKLQFSNIPLHIDYIDFDNLYITILNGDRLIDSLGDKYKEGIEVTAIYSGLRYHSKIESEKMIDTNFVEFISIGK